MSDKKQLPNELPSDFLEDKRTSTIYFGVYTPDNPSTQASVFEDKTEALKLAKKNKKSRFKAFQYYHEAAEFSLNGYECPNNNTTIDGSFPKKNGESTQGVGEKASPFRGPKPQELVEFRKYIEAGDIEKVQQLIWQNPRLLVSSGDTPSILQEGARQNALHIAAKAKNAALAQLVLDTVSNPEFVKELYGDDNQENAEERCKMLLDFYLNTPNKGLNETPLHFAAKFGAKDVVEVLVSYPQCDKTKRNKYLATAAEVNCTRADIEGKQLKELQKQIDVFLSDTFYVPVLRSEDSSIPPVIGEPFNPIEAPNLNSDPLSPRLEIHAYAGPMNKKSAEKFRKVWKTPPRSLNYNSPNGKREPQEDVINLASLKLKDPNKGLEKIGKRIAKKFEVCWKEYWPFLDCFVDISSEEGLDLLETHLKAKYNNLNSSLFESDVQSKYDQLNESLLQNFNFKKAASIEKTEFSPISNLCTAFSACTINSPEESKLEFDPLTLIDKACSVFANRISNSILYILCCDYDNILKVLENEIKQLELLVNSYMEDDRFVSVNFQKIHSRLGVLIGRKLFANVQEEEEAIVLSNKIESVSDLITKSLDCFSSDDEGNHAREDQNKPTIYRKQLVCLIHYILTVLSNNFENNKKVNALDETTNDWEDIEACPCVYHVRKKKNNLSRSNSFKNSKAIRLELENVSRKLVFEDNNRSSNNLNNQPVKNNEFKSSDQSDSGSDDEFFTPPSSPSFLSDDDNFSDPDSTINDVYLEGDRPTDTDRAVFEALKFSEVEFNSEKYPNIYRWRHNLKLFTEKERNGWSTLKNLGSLAKFNVSLNNSFASNVAKCSTPSKAWLRITGANSPRAAIKSQPNL